MTLTVINGMATASLTETDAPAEVRRAHMLSRRVNDVRSTVIEAEANTDASTSQEYDRRNHGAQTDVASASGIKDGGLQTQGQE